MITRTELEAYLRTLDADLQAVYKMVDRMTKEIEDTSEEDFQIAAELEDVFWKRCQLREEWKCSNG